VCEPITAPELLLLIQTVLAQNCTFRDRMHITLFLLMFVGLFRFDDVSHILVNTELMQFISKSDTDLSLDGVVIYIPHSKMDQNWNGAWVAIGATGKQFCPVQLLRDLLRLGGYATQHSTDDCGPLLRGVRYDFKLKDHRLAQRTASLDSPIPSLSITTFRENIHILVGRTNITKHIGLHGGRIGGANKAAASGIDSHLVCHLGRWKHGNIFDDTYVRMLAENARPFFEITRKIWPY